MKILERNKVYEHFGSRRKQKYVQFKVPKLKTSKSCTLKRNITNVSSRKEQENLSRQFAKCSTLYNMDNKVPIFEANG